MPSQLKDRLKKASKAAAKPLWMGPDGAGPNSGCTQSMISAWLVCRERFRVEYVLGLQPPDDFNHRIEYGSMFHACIEAADKEPAGTRASDRWQGELKLYCQGLCQQYPLQQEQVVHWMNVCKAQFPAYVAYWNKHKDRTGEVHTPLLQEQAFDVPYKLPSGRTARLRGKWDGVELIKPKEGQPGIWLDENKTRGEVDEDLLRRQLKFDLQTQWYMTALQTWKEKFQNGEVDLPENRMVQLRDLPIQGVRYNVIRRPLSGGKGSIKRSEGTKGAQCQKCKGVPGNRACPKCKGEGRVGAKPAETPEAFYARLRGIIEAEPETFFMRWTSEVSPQDVERFRHQFLNPVLENLLDDYEWWEFCVTRPAFSHWDYRLRAQQFPEHRARHFRLPYGIYSPLMDGRPSDLDAYLDDGSLGGLRRADRLFKELQ